MPPVRNSRVQTVARKVVHFVDVDGAGEHARQNLLGDARGAPIQDVENLLPFESPLVSQHVGEFALFDVAARKFFMLPA